MTDLFRSLADMNYQTSLFPCRHAFTWVPQEVILKVFLYFNASQEAHREIFIVRLARSIKTLKTFTRPNIVNNTVFDNQQLLS